MIIGDINNVISWLHINDIVEWRMSATKNGKQDNSMLFESDPEQPIEANISRMIERFKLSDNSIVYLQGRAKGKQGTVGFQFETWSNTSEQQQPVVMQAQLQQGVGAIADQNTIQLMIENAVAKERMSWMQSDLERREKELREAEREYKNQVSGVVGTLIQKAAPFVAGMMNKQHVAVAGVPEEHADEQVVEDAKQNESEDNIFSDDEQERIYDVCAQFKQFDPDYLMILEKLVGWATSGQDIQVVPGLVSMDYGKIKNLIIENM